MKKLVALIVALMLTTPCLAEGLKTNMFDDLAVSPESVEAVEEVYEEYDVSYAPSAEDLQYTVQNFLDAIGWKYTVRGEDITFPVTIDSMLGSVTYTMHFYDGGYSSYAYPYYYADTEMPDVMQDIAEYLHRANYGMRNGNFELDYSDGEIRYKSYVDCSDGLPGFEVLKRSITIPGEMFEIYGTGLLQVAFGILSPEDAIYEAEKQ